MGNGATKEKFGSVQSLSTQASPQIKENVERLEEDFLETLLLACRGADVSGKGMLDKTNFFGALNSADVQLNLSADERLEFLRILGVKEGGVVNYMEAIPNTRRILHTIYDKNGEDWNDWCLVRPY